MSYIDCENSNATSFTKIGKFGRPWKIENSHVNWRFAQTWVPSLLCYALSQICPNMYDQTLSSTWEKK